MSNRSCRAGTRSVSVRGLTYSYYYREMSLLCQGDAKCGQLGTQVWVLWTELGERRRSMRMLFPGLPLGSTSIETASRALA